MKNLIRRIRPEKTGVRAPLGDLEKAVMRCLWDGGDEGRLATEVQRHLETAGGRRVAVTTVLTTLDRLASKDIVRREPDGRANRFFPAMTEEQLARRIVSGVLDDLIVQFPDAVATYFSGRHGADAPEAGETLQQLAERVRAMRDAEGTTPSGE